MKQSNYSNNEPPIGIQIKHIYQKWCESLKDLQVLRLSPGWDKRHMDIHLEEIQRLYDEAKRLSKLNKNRQQQSFLDMILSRPVKEHMILAQGRHNIAG